MSHYKTVNGRTDKRNEGDLHCSRTNQSRALSSSIWDFLQYLKKSSVLFMYEATVCLTVRGRYVCAIELERH